MIVSVDDEESDAELLEMVIRRAKVIHPVRFLSRPEEFVAELRSVKAGSKEMPLACLLDIKMPGMTGLDLLQWIRSDEDFDQMPVVMLTSSSHPNDLERARTLKAQCYLVKFPKSEEIQAVLSAAERYQAEPHVSSIFDLPCNHFVRAPRM